MGENGCTLQGWSPGCRGPDTAQPRATSWGGGGADSRLQGAPVPRPGVP